MGEESLSPLCAAPIPGGQGHSRSASSESDSGEQRALPGAGTHPHAHAGRKRHQPQTGSHGRRGPGRRSQLINATSEGTGEHISSNIFRLIVNFLHFHFPMPAPVGFTAESLLEFSEALPKRTKAPEPGGSESLTSDGGLRGRHCLSESLGDKAQTQVLSHNGKNHGRDARGS